MYFIRTITPVILVTMLLLNSAAINGRLDINEPQYALLLGSYF